jgi:TrmH family RNA methyltransferase
MHQLTLSEDAQGIGIVVRQHWDTLESLSVSSELCWIALHKVRSPGNVGTILRTSDAVGGAGAILLGDEIDPHAPPAVRATMGSLFSQRLVRATAEDLQRWAQRHHCQVIGTSPRAAVDYRALSYREPTILLMGGERRGLPASLQALCDHVTRIPMVGTTDSLNLAVATGVMLYEVFNQRRESQP